MKQLIIFTLVCCCFTVISAQDYFMYVNGKKHYFGVSLDKVLIQFNEDIETGSAKDIINKNTSYELADMSATDYKGLKLVSFSNADKTTTMELVNQLKNKSDILYYGQVFIDKQGKEIAALTNQISIRLKGEEDYEVLLKSIIAYDINNIEQSEFDNLTYLLTLNLSDKNAMQIANELYEKRLFEYAEPNLLLFIQYETNDTYFSDQWGLNNTGQYGDVNGIDINANEAWAITTGSPNIKVAILDSGVDLTHPDLVNNLLTGYDATGGTNNGNHSGVGHGTSCAGIVAAQGNNSQGIVGVAYGCKILPIHMGDTPTAARVANGLHWARQNGANVVSMSFTTTETNDVNTAISQAVSAGCVLVAATGNYEDSNIYYPAKNSNIIAVGAISPCGERKSLYSCDTEYWGSNYGTELDVVAPGTLIPTTDIQSTGGYNPNVPIHPGSWGSILSSDYSNLNYTVWFNGTSSAAPHVAGVAALVLSVKPNLSAQGVKNIIESTAQKTRSDLYSYATTANRANGTWNFEMGYGLVDAYEAVNTACPLVNLTYRTITSNTTVTGCRVFIQNVNVLSNAKLTVDAEYSVIIESGFEVQLGSTLEIN